MATTATAPVFAFDSEKHLYTLNGCRIPSVSEIIRPCTSYGGISAAVMENAREFGTHVDLACQYYDEGDLDEDTLDTRVRERLNGWVKFKKEFEFVAEVIAQPTYNVMNGMPYGMTIDRFGHGVIGNMVVDIKNTAEIEAHHALQLAGYGDKYEKGGTVLCRRFIVQLIPNDFKIVEFKDRQDKRIFGALLAVAHWNIQKGIKTK